METVSDDVSTGTPGSQRKHRSNHLIGQFPRRPLNSLPGALRLCIDLRPRLASLRSGSLASRIQRSLALRIPLLGTLLTHLENLSPRQPQLVRILSSFRFCIRNRLVRILHGAFGAGATLRQNTIQRSLHQQLIGGYQHHKEQNCGNRTQ